MNKQKPKPAAKRFEILLYTHEDVLAGLKTPPTDWKQSGFTSLILGTQVPTNWLFTSDDQVAAHISNQLGAVGDFPWYLSLSTTTNVGDRSITFNAFNSDWLQRITIPNLQRIANFAKSRGCIGYLWDTERYGAGSPKQPIGEAWPDASKIIVEQHAQAIVNTIYGVHPEAAQGLHGFHSWEQPFRSYRTWTSAFSAATKGKKVRSFFMDSDAYNNAFEKWAKQDVLNTLEDWYGMDVWPFFYAASAGTAANNDKFYQTFLDNQPKLAKKCGGIGWYQNDDLFSREPQQGAAISKALKRIAQQP